MARRLLLASVLVVVLAAVAGTFASGADAYSGGAQTPINDPAYAQQVKSLLRNYGNANPSPFGTNAATGSAATAAEVESGLTTARGAALILPRVATFSLGVLAVAGAGYTGWKIGSPIGGYVYKRLTGETYGGSTSSLTLSNVRWLPGAAAAGYPGFFTGTSSQAGFYLNFDNTSNGYAHCGPSTITCAAGARTQGSALRVALQAGRYSRGHLETTTDPTQGGCNTGITPNTSCVLYYLTTAEYEKSVAVETDNAAGYAAASLKRDASAWVPPSSMTDANLEDARDNLGANDAATGSASQEAAIGAINHALDPGWQPGDPPPSHQFTPFVLPQPLVTETYLQYLDRLRVRGWLGTATLLVETVLEGTASAGTAYEAAPLYAPTAITVAGSSVVNVFDPANGHFPTPEWPDNPPHVPTAATGITVRYKSPSSVWPPPTGGGGGGLDFSPLTDLDPGCKFPYGFVCYASTVTGYFDVAPDAPVFDFTVDCPGLADCSSSGGTYEFGPVDLDVMDDYMDMWRTILAFVIWIGAVYLLATKLLGFHAGGDPGEAIDDAWPD